MENKIVWFTDIFVKAKPLLNAIPVAIFQATIEWDGKCTGVNKNIVIQFKTQSIKTDQ